MVRRLRPTKLKRTPGSAHARDLTLARFAERLEANGFRRLDVDLVEDVATGWCFVIQRRGGRVRYRLSLARILRARDDMVRYRKAGRLI